VVDELTLILSAGSVIIAVLSLINTHYGERAKMQERIANLESFRKEKEIFCDTCAKSLKALDEKADINSERVTRIETKMELFWSAMTAQAVDVLHHPEETRMDELLVKLKLKTITPPELEELKCVLKTRFGNKNARKGNQGFWAMVALTRIEMLLFDFSPSARSPSCDGRQA
jgi:hypothetical protein